MEGAPPDLTSLVLEVKIGEGFGLEVADQRILVSLLRIKGEKAKLLIRAARSVKIDRPYWKKKEKRDD